MLKLTILNKDITCVGKNMADCVWRIALFINASCKFSVFINFTVTESQFQNSWLIDIMRNAGKYVSDMYRMYKKLLTRIKTIDYAEFCSNRF